MFTAKLQPQKTDNHIESFLALSKAEKITAMWALSESTLGGLLHALKVPFRGMIILSVAIILIGMIARFSNKRGQIINSTLLVIFIKLAISPHTPVTAYLSVLLQGLLGEVFFSSNKIRLLSALLLGITVSLLNGFQRILVLTLIYGNTLWKSIDDLLNYIAKDWLLFNISNPIEFSLLLISIYVGMHLIIGIAAGVLAYTVPKSVEARLKEPAVFIPLFDAPSTKQNVAKPKKRKWLKPSAAIIIVISLAVVVLSYFYPLSGSIDINAIFIMLGRSVLIMIIWFYFLAPRITNYLKKYFHKRQGKYARDINSFLTSVPTLKKLVVAAWKSSSNFKGLKRIKLFLTTCLLYLLYEHDSSSIISN